MPVAPQQKYAMSQNEANTQQITRTLFIRGIVQGVGFRWSLREAALALGLCGWVRNRRDGSVEALIHGTPEAVSRLTDWAHHGPPGARVASVEMREAEREAEPQAPPSGFEQRPTA